MKPRKMYFVLLVYSKYSYFLKNLSLSISTTIPRNIVIYHYIVFGIIELLNNFLKKVEIAME